MGGADDPQSSSLSALLTYGADSTEETVGQPNSAPNVKSDASAPNASAAHVSAVVPAQPPPSQASQAPTYNPPDTTALTQAQGRLQTDQQTSNVKPKWWERTLGGLTAGAMAFGHVPGAVEAGQAVTNRGQNAAEDQRAGRVRSDQAAIQAWEDGQKQQQQTFQNQNEAFRTKQEGVRTDLEATGQQQQQQNADRNFNRETANDKFNQGRETKNDSWEQGFKLATQNENARHNKADEANAAANTSISRSRESRESNKQTADDKLSAPEVQQQKAANAAQDKYRGMVQSIEDGDPKGATPEAVQGFKATYRKASASATNPDTDKPWASPEEKTQYLDELKQQNADRKNSVMQSFAADMNRLGNPTPVVTYDKEGRATTSSATPDQGGATPTQGSPAAEATSPAATGALPKPPKPGTPLTDKAIARKFLDANGGDPAKARAAAKQIGWLF
jgi:hypothetical protein